MEVMIEEIKTSLREHNLKATKQRIQIMQVLNQTNAHPSAEMIMDAIKEQGIHMSFATVYNVLETLVDAGIIRKLSSADDIMRFDYNTDFHIHIHDMQTGQIDDYFDVEFCDKIRDYLVEHIGDENAIKKIDLFVETT